MTADPVAELAAIRTFITTVRRTEHVTSGVRQITFGGGDLDTFAPLGPDQFLYVLAAAGGAHRADDRRRLSRGSSTPRCRLTSSRSVPTTRCDDGAPRAGELDMLFVLHGVEGPAAGVGCWSSAG